MYTLGQSPTRSLKGLDALYLLRVDEPDVTNALPFHFAAVKEAVQMLDVVAQAISCLLGCQRPIHQPPQVYLSGYIVP
jgi:hypothetical protein